MDVKQEINPKAFFLPYLHSFLLLPHLKPQKIDHKTTIRVTQLVQEVGRQIETMVRGWIQLSEKLKAA